MPNFCPYGRMPQNPNRNATWHPHLRSCDQSFKLQHSGHFTIYNKGHVFWLIIGLIVFQQICCSRLQTRRSNGRKIFGHWGTGLVKAFTSITQLTAPQLKIVLGSDCIISCILVVLSCMTVKIRVLIFRNLLLPHFCTSYHTIPSFPNSSIFISLN